MLVLAASLIVVALIVPLVTASIGYITNWAGVKMIFHPEEFVGIGRVGWQGVLPSRAETFARDVAANVGAVISPADLVARLDLTELEELFDERLEAELPGLVREVAEMFAPGIWDEMVPEAREMVIQQIRAEGRKVAQDVFEDLQGISHELLDLEGLVYDLLSGPNVRRLVRLFQEIGGKELRTIVNLGFWFGLVVGIFQAATYSVLDRWWLMPIVGGIVGLGTNWLALQMIFRPIEPTRYAGVFTYQGMFPSRQDEIAEDYGRIAAREILTPANIIRLLTEGEASTRIAMVVLTRVNERVEAARPMVEMMTQTTVTDAQLATVKAMIVTRVSERIPELQPAIEEHLERRLKVAELIEGRLKAMPKLEFERLLRGIFEQDEWILVAIGGALGVAVGVLQGLLVLATG